MDIIGINDVLRSIEISDVFQSVIWSETDVSIALKPGEAENLRDALALIQKYEKAAFKAIKDKTGNCPTESDWYNVQYAVKNDRIIVKIKDGMAG